MREQLGVHDLKPREDRRAIVLSARVRAGPGWGDACILNISSRGLMIYAQCAAEPGSFVELHRGAQRIVARVVWRKNHRIGLCSRNPLPVEDIITGDTAAAAGPAITANMMIERRKQPRDAERSRERSRAIEFVSVVLIGAVLAGSAATYVQQTLSRSLSAVETALRPR